MTPAAQMVPPTTCKDIALHSVIAPVFTNGKTLALTAVRTNASLGIPAESAKHNKHLLLVVAVEAIRSACRVLRSATKKISLCRVLRSATALSGN